MTVTETSPADVAAGAPRRRIPVWLAIVAASIPMFMASLDNLVMTNALPSSTRTSARPSSSCSGS